MIAYNKLHILLLLSWQPRLKLKDGMRSIFPLFGGRDGIRNMKMMH